MITGKRSPQELTRAQRYKSLQKREGQCGLQVLLPPTNSGHTSTPAMSAGCDHSMLHMPIWTAQVAMHMAWPFKNRLSDSGPAISLLWRSSGKDYQGELFFLRLLVLRQGYRDGLQEKMREKNSSNLIPVTLLIFYKSYTFRP